MPDVSVIVPTYDRCDELLEAIASVQQGTYDSWEMIIADDGSRDQTPQCVEMLSDNRIQLFRHPHCGKPGVLRNRAVEKASAKIIAFLDSDDLWAQDKLSCQLKALQDSPMAGWCTTNATRDQGAPKRLLQNVDVPRESSELAILLMSHQFRIATPSVVVRRELFEYVGGFDEELEFCEDYDLWIRLALASPLEIIEKTLTITRCRKDHFPSPPIEVNRSWVKIMRKHLYDTNSRVRRCAFARLANHEAALARLYSRDGCFTKALTHLMISLRANPVEKSAWRELPRIPLRLAQQKWRYLIRKFA